MKMSSREEALIKWLCWQDIELDHHWPFLFLVQSAFLWTPFCKLGILFLTFFSNGWYRRKQSLILPFESQKFGLQVKKKDLEEDMMI